MSDLLLVPLLAAHLLSVNVASAGPMVAIWLDWRAGGGDQFAYRAGRFLVRVAPLMLVLGSSLGLIIGAMLWSDDYRELLGQFERKIYFGVWEIAFSFVLMLVCAAWWGPRNNSSKTGRCVRSLLQFLAATNLLYHFPFLFVVISDVGQGHFSPDGAVDARQFRQLIATGSVLARVVHIWLASFAVSGAALIAFAIWRRRRAAEEASRLAIWGGRVALVPTVLQIPVGLWVLVQLPAAAQRSLMGGDPLGAGLLVLSVMASLTLLHWLAAISFGDASRNTQLRTIALMVLIVLMMTAVFRRAT